ncbi:MAG TPA: hypothetical protein VIB11_03030 [Pedococcus sp.]|jgi:hypothetical protein|uniref:hypothetical protein n=1 Tax=Pedococcus sp. TaxID=2860345 RepID=UPI002F957091
METLRALWDWRVLAWPGLACLAPLAMACVPPGDGCPSLLGAAEAGPPPFLASIEGCEPMEVWLTLTMLSPVIVLAMAVAVEVAAGIWRRREGSTA